MILDISQPYSTPWPVRFTFLLFIASFNNCCDFGILGVFGNSPVIAERVVPER
jgi:hypothetical protein